MADQATELDLPFSGGAGNLTEAHHSLFEVSPEPSVVHLGLVLITTFIILFGVGSAFVKEKLYAGEAIIATLIGIAFGPYGAGLFNPRSWGGGNTFDDVVLEVTRVVIALSVFAVGVELPRAYMLKHWRSLAILLGPVMLLGWLISGALMYGLIPGIDFLQALVMAAAVTPTDPILAASVVGKGKFASDHVPSHVRHLLQSESGSNDGAAFPFLYLAMFILLRDTDSVGKAIGAWIYLVVLYQIVLGVFVGATIGTVARKVMKFAKRRALIDRESMVAMYVALALFSTSVTTLFGSDDLLAAFACGSAFAWDDWFTESIEESNFSAIIDLLVNSAIFFFVGATMPFDSWSDSEFTLTPWRLVVLGLCILLIRRMPAVYFLQTWIPDIHTRREAIFCGWFGPIGIGAIFISTLAATRLPTPNMPPQNGTDILTLTVQPVTYFLVLISIIAHGLSIPFFTGARRVHSISRTWTAGSNADGPSWLTRVRRVGDPRDIVVNRDDDDEKAELGEAGVDLGTDVDVRDFGTKSSSDDYDEKEKPESQGNDSEEARHEAHYSDKEDAEGEEVFQEGDTTVIERHGGEDVEEIEPTGEHKHFSTDEPKMAETAERKLDNQDEGPLGAMRRGASRGFSTTAIGQSLRDRARHFSIGEKYDPKREEEYKRERHDCRARPGPGDRAEVTRWQEGHRVVIERRNGEEVDVINEDPNEEAQAEADEHPHREVLSLPGFITGQRHTHRNITDLIREHLQSDKGDASRPSDTSKRGSHPSDEPEEGFLGRMRRGLSTTAGHTAEGDEGPVGRMRRGLSTQAIGQGLASRMKNFSIGTPYDPAREEEYKRERKDGRSPRSPPGQAMPEEPMRWRQGKRVVIERKGGEEVEVIDADPSEEAQSKAEKHPDRQVVRLPAFMTRMLSSDRPHPPLSQLVKQHLDRGEGSSSAALVQSPTEMSPPHTSAGDRELHQADTGSSGSSKGKEKAIDQDDASPADWQGSASQAAPPAEPGVAAVHRQQSGFLPPLQESGNSAAEDSSRLPAVEDRGRGTGRSNAPSAANSRNPSPSRGSIRFNIPLTDTQRSGSNSLPSAAAANQSHKNRRGKGRSGLKLKRH